jgi:hypothetical protein
VFVCLYEEVRATGSGVLWQAESLIRGRTVRQRWRQELTLIVSSTMACTLSTSRVSTATASTSPPASRISRATVLTVDREEFGSGGKGSLLEIWLVDLAATTTDEKVQ